MVTRDAAVARYAQENLTTLINKDGGEEAALAALQFDYLFSVANLDMLPERVLKRARRMAVNFHDAPLPAYAGLNAPCWAIMNGEARHGVTWHEMTARADAGRILAAAEFEIAADETAFSLNTKCYEAGAESFERLAHAIESGALELTTQSGARRYFGRFKRPSLGGALDLQAPAADVCARVRALHAGPYANPLGPAKLWTGETLIALGAAEAIAGAGEHPPGRIVAVEDGALVVSTQTELVRLSALTDLDGGAAPTVVAGAIMPTLAPDAAEGVDANVARAARAETMWLERLAAIAPRETPLPRTRSRDQGFRRAVIPGAENGLAACLIWSALIAGASDAAASLRDGAIDAALGPAGPWFSAWRPMRVVFDPGASVAAAAEAIGAAIAQTREAAPPARDLRLRVAPQERAELAPFTLPIALTFNAAPDPASEIVFAFAPEGAALLLRADMFDQRTAEAAAAQIAQLAETIAARPDLRFADLSLADEDAGLVGETAAIPDIAIADAIAAQAARTPERVALRTRGGQVTYAELMAQVDRAANGLAAMGVARGAVVGVMLERGIDMVVALIAIVRAGGAYLPLDPGYPAERLAFMIDDAQARLVITDGRSAGAASAVTLDQLAALARDDWRAPDVAPEDLAYLIYTSGSTGRPKGVMIQHRAVANFFVGMDARIPHDPPGVWLAVTSPNFDISVLELFWTLARGFTVALHGAASERAALDFSLFYFAAAAPDAKAPYKLLLEGAKFADANGFDAVWTPERHFHAFGAPYPNPAIAAAAIAATTTRVNIRAGSCVLPLHNPIRATEDWSMADVLSNGRVGVAIASGWQPTDFVLAPDVYKERKEVMLAQIETMRRLWRGEALAFPDPNGVARQIITLPRPVQGELPVWLTAAKSPQTFEEAGRIGAGVLTHMLGMSLDEVADNIRRYRRAWAGAGHPGRGRVTLMLHTFVDESDEAARARVREPMKRYLESAVDLVRDAAWSFPTFQKRAVETGKTPAEILDSEPLSPAETDALLEHSFERYFRTSGLFGAHETCVAMARKVAAIGVDEIACLIDFGVAVDTVIAHLPRLNAVREAATAAPTHTFDTVADDILHFGATHLQCTPSMAQMIIADPRADAALAHLDVLCVGGEALPLSLAQALRAKLKPAAKLMNMYGPTETTIWSSVADLDEIGDVIPLGAPIANTVLQIVGEDGSARPPMAPGELWIGGAGLAAGYWRRDDLTAEKFVAAPRLGQARMYRTGDLVRRRADGVLEFLGRLDHQVKIRGHRIELGDIEAALERCEAVEKAIVVAREDQGGDKRLVAYVVAAPALDADALRQALSAQLPDVMIPAAFVTLAALPLTPNGKVDRSALPEPQARTQEGARPADELEAAVAGIWEEALGVKGVSVTSNFFDMGGHSLLAVQVQRRMRAALAREVTITDIFRFPTVRALAQHLSGGSALQQAAILGAERGRARLAALRRARPPRQSA